MSVSDKTALMVAIGQENIAVIRELIKAGADLEAMEQKLIKRIKTTGHL